VKNGGYDIVLAPEDYPGLKYRGCYCQVHVLAYWRATGDYPSQGEVIHHIDLDRTNHNPINLTKMTNKDHSSLHNRLHPGKLDILTCSYCNTEFERRHMQVVTKVKQGQTKFYCCREHHWDSMRLSSLMV
jgi:hypothetical protein